MSTGSRRKRMTAKRHTCKLKSLLETCLVTNIHASCHSIQTWSHATQWTTRQKEIERKSFPRSLKGTTRSQQMHMAWKVFICFTKYLAISSIKLLFKRSKPQLRPTQPSNYWGLSLINSIMVTSKTLATNCTIKSRFFMLISCSHYSVPNKQ